MIFSVQRQLRSTRYPDNVRNLFLFCVVAATPLTLTAQIPSSETLSPADTKLFQAEVERVKGLLSTAGDKCSVNYVLARTFAAGGQYRQAFSTLQDLIDLNVGIDPSNDDIFRRLRSTNEYKLLIRQVHDDTPTVTNSKLAFTVDEPRLMPEGIAYEPHRKHFFLGSTWDHKIIDCTPAGECANLMENGQEGLFEVLGIKSDPRDRSIWAVSNSAKEAGLYHFETPTDELIRKYTLDRTAARHYFNDLVVSSKGDVFLTDTQAGTLYWVKAPGAKLDVFDPNLKVQNANGIALSTDDKTLYISSYPDGITVVDLASKTSHAIKHPTDLCLGAIDGLYYFKSDLVAVQNGFMTPRVVRMKLSQDLQEITAFKVLERRNPLFDGISTGAIADDAFYFMANTQVDKVSGGRIIPGAQFDPVKILRIDLTQ